MSAPQQKWQNKELKILPLLKAVLKNAQNLSETTFSELEINQRLEATWGTLIQREKRKQRNKKPQLILGKNGEFCGFVAYPSPIFQPPQLSGIGESHSLQTQYQREQNGPHSQRIITTTGSDLSNDPLEDRSWSGIYSRCLMSSHWQINWISRWTNRYVVLTFLP